MARLTPFPRKESWPMLKIARKIGPALLAVALVAACGGNEDGS